VNDVFAMEVQNADAGQHEQVQNGVQASAL